MEKINFFRTSNTAISIKEMICNYCEEKFYEIEDREIEECPLCGGDFSDLEPSENKHDDETYTLIVDPETGVPRILVKGEYKGIILDLADK